MEVPVILIDGNPVSEEEMGRLLIQKLLNTESAKRVLLPEQIVSQTATTSPPLPEPDEEIR